tara:strand:+ start:170 stop:283 length:114 start_codon:yes stop_codon:yes gene_type:complete
LVPSFGSRTGAAAGDKPGIEFLLSVAALAAREQLDAT